MPHDDKHYQKLQRTFKFVFDALWLVAIVLIVGLLLIWIYDKIGGTFLPRPWKIVLFHPFLLFHPSYGTEQDTNKNCRHPNQDDGSLNWTRHFIVTSVLVLR